MIADREQALKIWIILRQFKARRLSDSSLMDAFREIDAVYSRQTLGEMKSIDYLDGRVQCMAVEYERDGQPRVEFAMVWPKNDHTSNMTCLDIEDARVVLPALQSWVESQEVPS